MSGIIAQNTLDNTGLIKSPAGGGAWNFISKQTASGDSTIDFTSGLDSTYKEYVFTFNNIHTSATANFTFNGSDDASSHSYDITKTSTVFTPGHKEDDSSTYLDYDTGLDLAQGTGVQKLSYGLTTGNDESLSGSMHLFAPSDTVFVKHFMATSQYYDSNFSQTSFVAGYFNTTAAITAIQFKMTTGNIDLGDICLYGITT